MTTFLLIGVVGSAMLLVSLVAGDLADGLFDVFSADWFSTAVIGAFVSAFGFGGALAVALGAGNLVAIPVGVLAGIAFGWFASWLTRAVRGGVSGEMLAADDIVGHDVTVLTDIPTDGFGTVRVRVGEQVLQYNARAEQHLPAGTQAHVTGVLSPTAVTVTASWLDLPEQLE